ncbi:hypothetical protein FRC01_001082, partial [Tulasnella sp. 417]
PFYLLVVIDNLQQIGPYSARYSVHSFGGYKYIPSDVPHGCDVVQVNIVRNSFNGMVRDTRPATRGAASPPQSGISRKRQLVSSLMAIFFDTRAYTSGKYISEHYHHLSSNGTFIHSTSKDRVLESSLWFKHGFEGRSFPFPISELELPDVIIPTGSFKARLLTHLVLYLNNNTLSVDNCAAAEAAPEDDPDAPNMQWLNIYASPIAKRLNAFIPGLNLTATDANSLMSLCGFDTAFQNGKASPWCSIFKKTEWADNEYYWDLEKYYGSSYGSPYAKAQGSAVNTTLDSNPTTFPLPPNSPSIFADFSSDNNIAHIIAALEPPVRRFKVGPVFDISGRGEAGLLPSGETQSRDPAAVDGAKSKEKEEYVRMILNEGVVPLDLKECKEWRQAWAVSP